MTLDEAVRACRAVEREIEAARAELATVADLGWTGEAARLFEDARARHLRALDGLRVAAEHAAGAVLNHHIQVARVCGCGA